VMESIKTTFRFNWTGLFFTLCGLDRPGCPGDQVIIVKILSPPRRVTLVL
jgi:hypothetical protein